MISFENLRGLTSCNRFTDDQLEKIASIAEEREVERDEYVELEDNFAEYMYIVKQGRVAIEIELPRNRKVSVYVVEPGGLFGWSAVVPPHIITASSLCIQRATLICLPRKKLFDLFDQDIALKATVLELIVDVIRSRLTDTRKELTYLLGWEIS